MNLVLITDTHLPRRARDLPAPLWSAIDAADVVVHAGDWVDEAVLDAVAARSEPRRRQPFATYLTAPIEAGALHTLAPVSRQLATGNVEGVITP